MTIKKQRTFLQDYCTLQFSSLSQNNQSELPLMRETEVYCTHHKASTPPVLPVSLSGM